MAIEYYQPTALVTEEGYTIHDAIRTPNDKIVILCSDFPKDRLRHIQVYLQDEAIQHELLAVDASYYHRSFFIFITIPPALAQQQDPLNIKVVAPTFQYTATIKGVLFPTITHKRMTLTSLQKDNALEWIKDWCLYYHRVHSVDLVVLYDNGSAYRKTLAQELYALAPSLDIYLIEWDFQYGMATQVASLNHCYHALGQRSDFFLNFDIDEYLIYTSRNSLLDYVRRQASTNALFIRIPGQVIPMIHPPAQIPSPDKPLRVTDFCMKDYRSRFSNSKTISCYQEDTYVDIHDNRKLYTLFNKPQPRFAIIQALKKRFAILQWKIIYVVSRFLWGCHFYPYHPYFNHYAGLTNRYAGWRAIAKESLNWIPYNPKYHHRDELMQLMLRRAQLPADYVHSDKQP